jgi:hypothetical protein
MVSGKASVYARFKGPEGWEYQKVGKGRPTKGAKFRTRFTDAQGKRCWSQPFDTPQQAQENADGVALATEAAAQGLTVAEYQDQTNAGRTPIKVAVEKFLKLHRNDRPKTVKQYNLALTRLLANLPRGLRFIKAWRLPMRSAPTCKRYRPKSTPPKLSRPGWESASRC